ncbi:MAG TPA: hypothetical protein VK966_12915 [Longimicrobiales bacterium]|nr:hypothetical protein [Longimicrobiales bacterium]
MKRVLSSAFALALVASPAVAQEDLLSSCGDLTVQYSLAGAPPTTVQPPTGGEQAQEQLRYLCGQVVDAMTTLQPSIGVSFTGGNHTLGTATTIGRRLGLFPRISVTARATGALADGPDLLDGFDATIGEDGELPPMGTTGIPMGSLQGDIVVGLFNGLSFGPAVGGLGSVDLLGSLSFIPALDAIGLDESIVNWGAGARVGILRQGLVMPGISVSGMYRKMGEQSFGNVGEGDPAQFSSDLSTLSLRGAISKGILAFDLAAGAGYDIYSSDVGFDFQLTCPASECTVETTASPTEPIQGELKTAAWNVFGNVGLSLLVVNIVGEVGYQKATDVVSAADLAEAGLPDRAPTAGELEDGRFFGSVGVRFTF